MARVRGLDRVLANMRKEIKKIKGLTTKGLKKAVIAVEEDAVSITPLDLGPLRASSFNDVIETGRGPVGRVGYTAKYAAEIHERPMRGVNLPRRTGSQKGTYWDNGENKFLEKAVLRNHRTILKILKNNLPIKTGRSSN